MPANLDHPEFFLQKYFDSPIIGIFHSIIDLQQEAPSKF